MFNKKYEKNILFLFLFILFLSPLLVFAQNKANKKSNDKIFSAQVVEILTEKQNKLSDGTIVQQQKLKLQGLNNGFLGKNIIFNGIGDFDVINKHIYKTGDKVLVVASYNDKNEVKYYITDYVRTNGLLWLSILFVLSIIVVGRFKGLRALISLIITFFIIIKYIIPYILNGSNPLLITFLGSLIILIVIVYLTEGFTARSHITIVSIFFSLMITIFLSWIFVYLAKLSGLASEETASLINLGGHAINFRGLLLAGIIIGTLGVLDDVVISQVASVEQISQANQYQTKTEVFQKAYQVGISHASSMANTLFLAYAGASLPLLILFISGQSAFSSWGQIINNETIATEIVRTLSGSVGLILAVPLATILAVLWYKRK